MPVHALSGGWSRGGVNRWVYFSYRRRFYRLILPIILSFSVSPDPRWRMNKAQAKSARSYFIRPFRSWQQVYREIPFVAFPKFPGHYMVLQVTSLRCSDRDLHSYWRRKLHNYLFVEKYFNNCLPAMFAEEVWLLELKFTISAKIMVSFGTLPIM